MKNIFTALLINLTIGAFGQTPAQQLPVFEFRRLNKISFTNKDLPRQRILLFIFVDTECDHCQRAVKNIDLQYKSFQKAAVYLISQDSTERIDRFMSAYGPTLKAQKNVFLLQDHLNQFIEKFKPRRYPAMFVYSSEKKLLDYEDNEESVFRLVNTVNKNSK